MDIISNEKELNEYIKENPSFDIKHNYDKNIFFKKNATEIFEIICSELHENGKFLTDGLLYINKNLNKPLKLLNIYIINEEKIYYVIEEKIYSVIKEDIPQCFPACLFQAQPEYNTTKKLVYEHLKPFNDFLTDIILEKVVGNGVTELPFMLSLELVELLKKINHPISDELLKMDKERGEQKVTFIDIDNEKYSPNDTLDVIYKRFTLINSNKVYDEIINHYTEKGEHLDKLNPSGIKKALTYNSNINGTNKYNFSYWTKNRAAIRIGSFIKKVMGDKFKDGGDSGNDIESFVNSIIAYRKSENVIEDEKFNRFKLVKGEDIIKYYNYNMYDLKDKDGDDIQGTPLGGSCMRHDRCEKYINFYAKNKDVSLLILFSDKEPITENSKIVGRAIVWNLEIPEDRIYMDRIYYRYEDEVQFFKMYAKEHGWLYKKNQNMLEDEEIVDPLDNTSRRITLKTKETFEDNNNYPYMDTLKFFIIYDKYLTNNSKRYEEDEDTVYKLDCTDGSYSTYEDDEDDEDDHEGQTYLDYLEEWYDDEDVIWCEYGDEHVLSDDAIFLGFYNEYATESYADNNMLYSDYHNEYIMMDDAIWSIYVKDYIYFENSFIIQDQIPEMFDDSFFKDISDYNAMSKEDIIENNIDIRPDSEFKYLHPNLYMIYIKNYKAYYFLVEQFGDYFVNIQISTETKLWKNKIWDKDEITENYDGTWSLIKKT